MLIKKQFPDKNQFKDMASQKNVIPVCVEILADTETPVSLLREFYKNHDPVFLFESVEGGERWGRYSFLSASARCHIRVYSKHVEIEENGHRKDCPHNGDPLSVLRDMMKQYRPAHFPGLPRFWGGMVGYLTYEMVSFFEAIPNQLPESKPIAHFVIPDELLIFDNIRHTLLVVAISFLSEEANIDQAFEDVSAKIRSLLEKI